MAAHLTFSCFLITVLIGKILVKFTAKLVFINSGGGGGGVLDLSGSETILLDLQPKTGDGKEG
jgi:hypothetical protein